MLNFWNLFKKAKTTREDIPPYIRCKRCKQIGQPYFCNPGMFNRKGDGFMINSHDKSKIICGIMHTDITFSCTCFFKLNEYNDRCEGLTDEEKSRLL